MTLRIAVASDLNLNEADLPAFEHRNATEALTVGQHTVLAIVATGSIFAIDKVGDR